MTTMDQIKERNKANGKHFFDYDTVRFFNSFEYDKVIQGSLFITSEQMSHESQRLFTIRRAVKGGEQIETVGAFGKFESYGEAEAAAHSLQSCVECGIDLFDDETYWRNQEPATREYPGNGGDPYCEEHAGSEPEWYGVGR